MLADTYEHEGVKVELHYDHDAEHANPRQWDNLTEMHVQYPGYSLGDEEHELPRAGFPEIDCPRCDGRGYITNADPNDDDCPKCLGMGMVEPTVEEWLTSQKAIVAAPLFVYEHSGITIRTGGWKELRSTTIKPVDVQSRNRFLGDEAGWDTSFVGFALVTLERALELGIPGTGANGVTDHQLLINTMVEQGEAEVETYASYLEGDVYGYVVAPGTFAEESCWGFIGEPHVKASANEEAKYAAKQLANEAHEAAEMAARGVITV